MRGFDSALKRMRESRKQLESRWDGASEAWVDQQQQAFNGSTMQTLVRSSSEMTVELTALADTVERELRSIR